LYPVEVDADERRVVLAVAEHVIDTGLLEPLPLDIGDAQRPQVSAIRVDQPFPREEVQKRQVVLQIVPIAPSALQHSEVRPFGAAGKYTFRDTHR
jgi:hypothetical protein